MKHCKKHAADCMLLCWVDCSRFGVPIDKTSSSSSKVDGCKHEIAVSCCSVNSKEHLADYGKAEITVRLGTLMQATRHTYDDNEELVQIAWVEML